MIFKWQPQTQQVWRKNTPNSPFQWCAYQIMVMSICNSVLVNRKAPFSFELKPVFNKRSHTVPTDSNAKFGSKNSSKKAKKQNHRTILIRMES